MCNPSALLQLSFVAQANDSTGQAAINRLQARVGAVPWESTAAERLCVRLVTAFNTTAEEVEQARLALLEV